jgi:cell division protein FtsI/penicillin-binding protein 2
MLGRTDSRRRLLFLLVALAIAATAIVGRLAYWQVVMADELSARARAQTTVTTEIPSRRGAIYDRSGVVVLATTVDRDRLVAAPEQLTQRRRAAVAAELVGLLRFDGPAAAALTGKMTSDRPYVILARDLEPEASERIRLALADGRVEQVSLEPEPARIYPQAGGGPDSSLAAHLLGFVNREGEGQYGVEQRYQELLAGQPRVVVARRDINARAIPESAVTTEYGVPGVDLRLTIDAGLQLALEQELLAAWVADHAISASAVVLDPYSGEIYAHATYPAYDANQYRAIAATDPARFIDPVVSEVYEPGSVFKMMTAVAALESGVTPDATYQDVGTLKLDGGRTKVDNADRKGRGTLTFEDAIAWSRNVVAAKIALGLGPTTRDAADILYEVWTRLGFGAPTGIDVAGEVAGLVRDPAIKTWREIDLANGAFGQGVAVTPIQLATAFSAMVNGGRLIQPHVVKAIGEEDVSTAARAEILDSRLTPTLVDLMNHVVSTVPFYRDRTLIPGYYVGGKTGTAQIWDPTLREGRGDWKKDLFNYSFVGFVGRHEGVPELVVAVRINEAKPTVIKVGQLEMPVMSFELFRRIATDAITTPALLPDRPRSLDPVPADR